MKYRWYVDIEGRKNILDDLYSMLNKILSPKIILNQTNGGFRIVLSNVKESDFKKLWKALREVEERQCFCIYVSKYEKR